MTVRGRIGYLALCGVLAAGVAATAAAAGLGDVRSVAVALGLAWVLQAPAFWLLDRALDRQERVVPIWVGGMGVRLGGLAVAAVAGGRPGWERVDMVLAYAVAMVLFLTLEAVWLYRGQRGAGRRPDSLDRGGSIPRRRDPNGSLDDGEP